MKATKAAKTVSPHEMTLDQLRECAAELARRNNSGRPAQLLPCIECSEMLSARQRRAACPKCGASNRNTTVAASGRATLLANCKTWGDVDAFVTECALPYKVMRWNMSLKGALVSIDSVNTMADTVRSAVAFLSTVEGVR